MVINSPGLTTPTKNELAIPGQTATVRNVDSKKFLNVSQGFTTIFDYYPLLKDLLEPINDTYDTPSHTKKVAIQSNEPPLSEGHTSRNGEGSMEHTFELMDTVLDLEKEKDAQAIEILKLKQRVKKLERKRKSSISHLRRRIYRQVESSDDDLDKEDASKQGRTSDKTKPIFKDSDFDDLDDVNSRIKSSNRKPPVIDREADGRVIIAL
ncbi:hypothetical protein Tco_1170347 [Tanacetum coccineum]